MLDEINEDNCVLSNEELKTINLVFKNTIFIPASEINANEARFFLQKLLLKINKLNDWYKNTHLEKIGNECREAEFAEVEENE